MEEKDYKEAYMSALHKIHDWIKGNIVSELKEKGSVAVSFDVKNARYGTQRKDHLTVSNSGNILYYSAGAGEFCFDNNNQNPNTAIANLFKVTGGFPGEELILNWQTVKQALLAELEERKKRVDAIIHFEV